MRYYAIVGTMRVMSNSKHKFKRFFSSHNKTSITPKEAKDFFYSSSDKLELFESFDDALNLGVKNSSREGYGCSEELYPNRHKLWATPIFTVELLDDVGLHSRHSEPVLTSDIEKKAASELGLNVGASRDVWAYSCEKIAISRILAVYIRHPNFKKQHIEIDAPTQVLRKS